MRLRAGFLAVALATAVRGPAAAQRSSSSADSARGPLSLGDAIRLAARRSTDVVVARYQTEQASARVRQKRADLLPTISALGVGSGRSYNVATFGFDFPVQPGQPPLFDPTGEVIGPVRTLDLRGRATVPIFDPVAWQRVKSASSDVQMSEAEAEVAAQNAGVAAANLYLGVLRSEALVRARLADSVLADSLVGIAREQLQAGVAVGLDVTRAESQLALARADLISARSDRDKVRLQLLHALTLPLDTAIELADTLGAVDSVVVFDQAAATARALARRPELRSAEASLRAAEQSAAAERSERLPRLEAFGDYGFIGKTTNRLLGTYDWGVQVTVPIFNGFGREGRIAEADARSREITERRRDLEARVALEVRTVALDLVAARQRVEAARDRLRLATQELAQARERFQAGVAGNADVITALLGLNQARTLEVEALTSYRAAVVGRARAQGDLLELR